MQNKKVLLAVVVVLVVVVGYLALKQGAPASADVYKIGFIGPLTGDAASIGIGDRAGVQVAVDEISKAGGINGKPIQMIYEDGKCSTEAAVSAAQKLINVDKVVAIIGGACSTETAAFGPMAMQNKVITFSYVSSAPSLSKLGKYFFRDYPSDSYQGAFGAEYAYQKLGARKVAILYAISEYGTGIKDVFVKRFQELSGTVAGIEGLPQTATDYRTPLAKIKSLGVDLIYAPMYPDGIIASMNQAKQLGVGKPVLGADGWDDPKVHKAISGKGSFIYTAPVTPAPDDFKAKIFAITHGTEISIGTPNAYDAAKILAAAIAKVGTDPDKLASAIRATKYDGVSGHIEFDANGDLTSASYVVKKIQNGTAIEVK